MSRKDFSQQFPCHRDFQFRTHHDFSQQFPSEHDFSQQFQSEHDFSNMIPNEPVNTPPENIFPVFTPENERANNPPVFHNNPINRQTIHRQGLG